MCKEGNVKRAWIYIILHFINYNDVNVIKGFIFVVSHNHWVKTKVSQSSERAVSTVSNRDIKNVLFTHLLQRLMVVLILISELTWLLRLSSQHRKKKKSWNRDFVLTVKKMQWRDEIQVFLLTVAYISWMTSHSWTLEKSTYSNKHKSASTIFL